MGRPPSPAQRAVQITFVLKGHLKNVQVAYIRVAALLARVRDEKLYRALGHATMDDYAAARLRLQHAHSTATSRCMTGSASSTGRGWRDDRRGSSPS